MDAIALFALLVLIGVGYWIWRNSPITHQIRRRRVIQSSELVAVSAIAVARFERTRQLAAEALPNGLLRDSIQTAALPIFERTAVESGALATRIRAMWGNTPEGSTALFANAMAADSARAALADARSPLTRETVNAMTPPEMYATLQSIYEGSEDMYISQLAMLAIHTADIGKKHSALLAKAVAALSGADQAALAVASLAAEADADAVL